MAAASEVQYDENGVRWLKRPVTKPFTLRRHLPGELKMSALAEACSRGDTEEVRELLEKVPPDAMARELQARDDWAGSSPLHWACFAEHGAACVEMLLDHGADVYLLNERDRSTPIHLAARYGRLDSVKVLVTHGGCEVDTMNNLYNTPLHECAFQVRGAAHTTLSL